MELSKKFRNIVIICAVIALLSMVGIGVACYYGGRASASTLDLSGTAVSYQAKDTQVYSSTAQVVDAVADCVVEIRTESVTTRWGKQYIVSGAGSGVTVGSDGNVYFIVTNNHVIQGANDITVTMRSGEEYAASLVATDDSADIAVIAITSADSLNIAVWGNSDELKIGEDLIAIGNPLGSLGGTVTKGILSATGRTITVGNFAMTLLQTDTAINPGNSGGGLFNMRGQLIGIVNAKTTDEEIEGICFAIPCNIAKRAYEDLLQYGYIKGRATLGITLEEGTISSGGVNAQTQSIVYIASVSNAENGTFEQYDRLYSINGEVITSILDYNIAMSNIKPNDTVTVQVYRGYVTPGFFGNSIAFDTDLTAFTVKAVQYGE